MVSIKRTSKIDIVNSHIWVNFILFLYNDYEVELSIENVFFVWYSFSGILIKQT
jgi:hypothetical protein